MKRRRWKSKQEGSIDSISALAARNRLVKAAAIATGLAALTLGSTAISSLRRRMEETS
jgi:hypothetical protein